ncbi:hypothetical protein ACIBI4_25725 [Streptomyces sp. NPDC050418]|uniref:hypothetical protein n=1 Tax=Streptomyces sp. NPDC050418 TaxID=3365612 RepID=UPI00378A27E4
MAKRYRGPWLVTVGQHQMHCPVCRGALFWEREVQLNTAGMTFMRLDWANDSATGIQCAQCSRLELFTDRRQLGLTAPASA